MGRKAARTTITYCNNEISSVKNGSLEKPFIWTLIVARVGAGEDEETA